MNAHESISLMTYLPPFTPKTLPDAKAFGYLKELLAALTGGNRPMAKKLAKFVKSETLAACLGSDRALHMDLNELNRLRKFFALPEEFLAGKADMFGQPLKGLMSTRVPAFCVTGDRDIGEYLAGGLALRHGSLDAADILTALLPPQVIPDRTYAQGVLTGTRPLGLMALWELYAELEKQDAVYPPLQELLGVSGPHAWRLWPPVAHLADVVRDSIPPLNPVELPPVAPDVGALTEAPVEPVVQVIPKVRKVRVAKPPLAEAEETPVELVEVTEVVQAEEAKCVPVVEPLVRSRYQLKGRPRHSITVLRRLANPRRITFRTCL